MDYWAGKVAVITGASSGIGANLAQELAQAGLQVVGLARRKDRIEALQCRGRIHAIECDVTQIESVEAAFSEIRSKFGKVNILINCAGRGRKGKVLDQSVPHHEYLATINVNFSAVVICTREAFKLIENHDELAYIININSSVGHTTPWYPLTSDSNVYAASKHAVTNHTEALRIDLAHANYKRVRVSSISPGLVKTDIFATGGYPADSIPFTKMPSLDTKDIADAVIHLLSLPASVNVSELTIKGI